MSFVFHVPCVLQTNSSCSCNSLKMYSSPKHFPLITTIPLFTVNLPPVTMRIPLILLSTVLIINAHLDTKECGGKKQCVFVPAGCQENNVCSQIFSYSAGEDGWTDMELFASDITPGTNYISVGFSEDDIMGEEPVTHCAFPSGKEPTVHATYNNGKSNQAAMGAFIGSTAKSLEMVESHADDSHLYCHFRQKTSGDGSQFTTNLDADKTIFLARGKTKKPEGLGIHSLDPASPDFPFVSAEKINVGKRSVSPQTEDPTDNNESHTNDTKPIVTAVVVSTAAPKSDNLFELTGATRLWFVRIHGILMVIAWMFFVSTAVLSARYLRDHWPGSNPCGLKWWFHLHRTLNMAALPLIILATLFVFVAKDWRWTGPTAFQDWTTNSRAGAVHSLLGAIAVCSAIFNPLMALMRCAPDTGARPIFNWLHFVVGVIGVVCALLAILIAANSFVSLWSDASWALAIVSFFVVALILAIILFEVLTHLKTRRSDKIAAMEMRHRGGSRYDDHGRVINSPKLINPRPMYGITAAYILWALFALGIAAFLIVMLVV